MPVGVSIHSMVGISPYTGSNCTANRRVCRKLKWIGSVSFSLTWSQLQGEWRTRRTPAASGCSKASKTGKGGHSSGGPM